MVEEAVKREVAFLPVEQPLNLQATMESGQLFRWSREGEWYRGVIGEHGYALKQVENGLLVETSATATGKRRRHCGTSSALTTTCQRRMRPLPGIKNSLKPLAVGGDCGF